MNYLAHAYLSFTNGPLMVGNLMGDFVKGNTWQLFDKKISAGIILHRHIDTFTDAHPTTKEAAATLKPAVGAYAGAFVDVAYDHFLARDKNIFITADHLQNHALWVYATLAQHHSILPQKFKELLPHMTNHDWLSNYQHLPSIQNSFNSIFYRAKYLSHTPMAYQLFLNHYDFFQACYNNFFPQLKNYVKSQIEATENI